VGETHAPPHVHGRRDLFPTVNLLAQRMLTGRLGMPSVRPMVRSEGPTELHPGVTFVQRGRTPELGSRTTRESSEGAWGTSSLVADLVT